MKKGSTKSAGKLLETMARAYFDLFMHRAMSMPNVIGDYGLSAMQLRALCVIMPHEPKSMRDVAERIGCAPSNLTGVADHLESRKLVVRMNKAEDRRTKMLSLTPAGVALRAKVLSRFSEPAPWMLALSPEEQRQLLAILQKGLAYEAAHPLPQNGHPAPPPGK